MKAASLQHLRAAPRPSPERGSPLAPDTRTQAAPNIPILHGQPPASILLTPSPKGREAAKQVPLPSELLQSSRGRGAQRGPPKSTEASSPGPNLLNRPRALALPNGDGSAKRAFLPTRAPPDPPKPEREQTLTAPVPLSRPAPASTHTNHQPP